MTNITLIIGASSEIGLNLIKSIDEECLIIAHFYKSSSELDILSRNIKNKLVLIQSDLSQEIELFNFLDTIEKHYGLPTKIVHLAAPKFKIVKFKDLTWADYQNEIDISLKALVIILNRFLPKLAKCKKGKVVCMLSSVVINMPPKALSHYITTKYALLGLVKSLAHEYASKNIQINAVSPSMVETKFLDNIDNNFIELSAYNNPLKRNACVGDIIPVVKMLISDDSNYITGVNIPITGGSTF